MTDCLEHGSHEKLVFVQGYVHNYNCFVHTESHSTCGLAEVIFLSHVGGSTLTSTTICFFLPHPISWAVWELGCMIIYPYLLSAPFAGLVVENMNPNFLHPGKWTKSDYHTSVMFETMNPHFWNKPTLNAWSDVQFSHDISNRYRWPQQHWASQAYSMTHLPSGNLT